MRLGLNGALPAAPTPSSFRPHSDGAPQGAKQKRRPWAGNHVTDVFEQVEEDIRRERMADAVRRYGPVAAAGFALIVLGILAFEGYRSWKAEQDGSYAMELAKGQELLEKGQTELALKAFQDVAAKGSPGYKALARMEEAGVLVAKGDLKGAVKALDDAAAMTKDPIVKDAAVLRAAYLAAESEPLAAIEARIKPLIDKSSPYAFLGRELLAFEAFKAGDTAKARENFEFLTLALDAPEGVRQRAQGALASLGPKPEAPAAAAAKPEAVKPAAPAAKP